MMRPCTALATVAGFAVCESLGGAAADTPLEVETERNETKWEFSLSTFTYLAQHARDYVNPNFTADRDWLHLGRDTITSSSKQVPFGLDTILAPARS